MKITKHNVDLPDELFAALMENRLVIFVGAGISARAYPQQKKNTYYPLFKDLCRKFTSDLFT